MKNEINFGLTQRVLTTIKCHVNIKYQRSQNIHNTIKMDRK